MMTFREYCENKQRLHENWLMNMADKFLSRYGKNDYSPGIDRSHSGPSSPTGRFPLGTPDAAQFHTPSGPAGPESLPAGDWSRATADPDSQAGVDASKPWDVDWRNVVDNPTRTDDELRQFVYKRIGEIVTDPNYHIRQPSDVYAVLEQDPEIQVYLRKINASQKGAFTRKTNSMVAKQAQPLRLFGGDQGTQTSATPAFGTRG